MCDKFIITVNLNKLFILNVADDVSQKNIQLHMSLINAKVEEKTAGVLTWRDGCQNLDSKFSLQADDAIDNEDFIYTTLESSLKVNLSIETASEAIKKRKNASILNSQVTCGEVNMLHALQKFLNSQNKSFVMMQTIGNMEIAIDYVLSFENFPNIASTLLFEIIDFHSFEVNQNSKIEACLRFPYNESFRAGIMRQSEKFFKITEEFLLDDILLASQVEFSTKKLSKIKLEYENFQSDIGVKFFHQFIAKKQSILMELKVGEKMMMTLIDLDIFNYPDVNEMIFMVPLYEWNKHIIRELFQQDACLTEEVPEKPKKKLSMKKKSMFNSEEDQILKPIINYDKNAAISIKIKFKNPVNQAESLDDLSSQLNNKLHFMNDETEEQHILRECHEIFKSTIEEITIKIEKCIHENPVMSEKELRLLIEELYDKKDLKEVVKNLIGNVYNRETTTETNQAFKLLMLKVFKSLSREVMEILKNKWENDENEAPSMNEKVRRCQIDEWILMKNPGKAREILNQSNNLEESAFYQFKMHNFDKCEETIFKILKNDSSNKLALYLLTSLKLSQCDVQTAIILLKLLVTIQPYNFEFWMLLSSLYEEIDSTCAIKFASTQLRISKFIPMYDLNESMMHPSATSINPIMSIFQQQLQFGAFEFLEVTKKFMDWSIDNFENKIVCVMEAFEKCQYEEASTALNAIIIDDDNEAMVRILRGNVLYATHYQWRAVCEYEIAYNLYLKTSKKFPHLPALRCAQWYLYEIKNTTKARRYFHYCCKNFATFNSWNGLGVVNLVEASYKNAESCFHQANQIHKNSGENWLNLALVNCKLGHFGIALECYMAAKNCGVVETEILYDVEKALRI